MSAAQYLYAAIARGDSVAVERIISQGGSVTDRDPDGFTALMHAILVESCSDDIVSALIRAGADVNAKDDGQQWTPLAFAARDGKLRICELLLASGADIDSTDVFGCTPLWRAALGRKHDIVNLLVQQGANLDHANRRGVTPRSILDHAVGN